MDEYDPSNVKQYFGYTFFTASGSRYGITTTGRFIWRSAVERPKVKLIAGIEGAHYSIFTNPFLSKEMYDQCIEERGKRPKIGLHLVVGFTEEYSDETNISGIITSLITAITPPETEPPQLPPF